MSMQLSILWAPLWLTLVQAQTATISLGDLNQYIPAASADLPPNGTTISYSGDQIQGLNISLSPDLQADIQKATSSCQSVNESCLESVHNQLINPNTNVQARAVAAYTVFEVLTAIGEALAFFIITWGVAHGNGVPARFSFPPHQIAQASLGANASVTVFSADNTTPFTITPTPSPTTITGSVTPSATTYTAPAEGHIQGDVLISLPSDLAARMSDFIHISADCPVGDDFDYTPAKRSLDFGDVLCGSEGLIVNSVPGGPFADFRLMNMQPLPFTNADAIRAMNAAMDFARNFATNLQLSPDQAALLGVAAFAVSWALWNNNQGLGTTNVIPAAELAGTITTPPSVSTTATATCSVCFASCGFVGPIQICSTDCSSTSACTSSATGVNYGGEEVVTTTTVAYTDYGTGAYLAPTYTSNTTSMTATTIPVFPGGPVSLPPPASIDTTPTPTPTPSPTPSPTSTSLPTPSLGDQNCNAADAYGKKHPDIHESSVATWLGSIVCKDDQSFNKDTPPFDWNPVKLGGKKDNYHYRISWISGCETTETSQQKLTPLGSESNATCVSLLYQDYKNCVNGGVGGWRDAGCLRYEQNPSTA